MDVGTNIDFMYNEEETKQLMEDLKEMETFKADVGDEGKILQEDLKDFFINGNGDKEDLCFRIELYFYAFKLVMDDLTDFELEIEATKEEKDALINLNFTLHF